MKEIDKIKEIHNRRNFMNFWECFDYLKLGSYDEIEALILSSILFNGNIWSGIINVSKQKKNTNVVMFCSGTTSISTYFGDNNGGDLPWYPVTGGTDPIEDDLIVEIFYMNNKARQELMPIYKAYTETKRYEKISELEDHIKSIKINLTTELAIKLFNDGFKNF